MLHNLSFFSQNCKHSNGNWHRWLHRYEIINTVYEFSPICPVLAFQMTSMQAFSGFSFFFVPALGPKTAASTLVSPET